MICGGSIGGLFVAAYLRKIGWQVEICERAGAELSGRGAGIVTHDSLLDMLSELQVDLDGLGVTVHERVVFDRMGDDIRRVPFTQIVTSWDRIHHLLRASFPNDCYHLGHVLTGYEQHADHVVASFSNGREIKADLLVGADGFASATRGLMQPAVTPLYSGYVVWRALARESDLRSEVHARIFDSFGIFAPSMTQIIGYPIAGAGNDLRPGHRRYNFVWYSRADETKLSDMLVDRNGTSHPVTIPPPLIRDEILADMAEDARRRLPPDFNAMLDVSERPFFTPIYDHHSPVMGQGRVALAGDAACVARPHVGMGVTKAACDARALASSLRDQPDVASALDAYSAERVPASRAAFERSRRLGAYIFEGQGDDNRDGRSHPHLDDIVELTATMVA